MTQPESTSNFNDPIVQPEPLHDFLAKLSLAELDLTREDDISVNDRDPLSDVFPNKAV